MHCCRGRPTPCHLQEGCRFQVQITQMSQRLFFQHRPEQVACCLHNVAVHVLSNASCMHHCERSPFCDLVSGRAESTSDMRPTAMAPTYAASTSMMHVQNTFFTPTRTLNVRTPSCQSRQRTRLVSVPLPCPEPPLSA